MKRLLLTGVAVLAASALVAARQLPGAADLMAKIPGLEKVLAQKDALSSSLDTATSGVMWLDLFEPQSPQAMADLPRTADGGVDLRPGGFYQMRVQSFCLQAGTRRPAQGDGFLDAPLGGPRGSVVQHILEQASRYVDIPQDDVQAILWTVLARAKVSDLPRALQVVAARLLTPAELAQVNGGALSLIAGAVRDVAFERLPPAVARVLAAEADLRDLIGRGAASYAEMESLAIASDGDEPAAGTEIPASRWNFVDGLYVRYQPEGYQTSVIQVYVPAPSSLAKAERDRKGRLSRLTDPDGRVISIFYDEGRAPIEFSGDPGVKAWALARVTYSVPAPGGAPPVVGEAEVDGWVLVGVPNGRGIIRQSLAAGPASAPRFGVMRASFAASPRGGGRVRDDEDLAADLAARYSRAAKLKGYADKARGQGKGSSASDVVDEDHYRDGMDKVRKLDFKGEGKWINQHNESVGKLAAWTHCELSGACGPDGGGVRHFKPAGKVGVPAAGQRIGMSGRPAR